MRPRLTMVLGLMGGVMSSLVAACAGSDSTECSETTSCPLIKDGGEPVVGVPGFEAVQMFSPPVANVQISSTFGPRWKFSESRDDFHLGIDYYGPRGTPLLAIGPGRVSAVHQEGSAEFPNGGNVVVIEHAMPQRMFHGRVLQKFYALYLHAETIDVAVGEMVSAGDTVATMGDSGTTEFVHLHFETRVGTVCSLPYQIAHPNLSCVTYFDPHVHPFLFVGGENTDMFVVEEIPATSGFAVRYTATRGDLDLDAIETDLGTIGFVAREGIDATSIPKLDDFRYGFMEVDPQVFVSASTMIEYELHFPDRPAYLELRDIYGRGLRFGRHP